MTNFNANGESHLTAPFVLVSDIHIQHMADKRARLLLDALERLGPQVETVVLNGDICDFCFGDSDYFRHKFRPLGEALMGLAQRGVRVIYVEGNHEFHLERIGWKGIEIVQERDLYITLKSGVRLKVTHGDLLTDEPLYKLFRGTLKSQAVRFAAAYVPGGWLDAYALRHAKFSRAQDHYRTLKHDRILDAFARWTEDSECDHGIIGHFHVPYAEKHPRTSQLMMSVASWDQPNLLVFQDDAFQRILLQEPGLPFVRQPASSIFTGT